MLFFVKITEFDQSNELPSVILTYAHTQSPQHSMSPITQHTHSFFSSSVSPSLAVVIAVVVVVVCIVVFVRVSVVVRLVLGVVLAVVLLLLLAIGFFVVGVVDLVLVWVVGAATAGRGVGCGFQAGPVGSGPSTTASSHTLRT